MVKLVEVEPVRADEPSTSRSNGTRNGRQINHEYNIAFVQEARRQADLLDTRKKTLEKEIEDNVHILRTNQIGMDESLLDAEGFPRTDVDVYAVRQARSRVICLRNDLNQVCKEREDLVHKVHSNHNIDSSRSNYRDICRRPIAKVNTVQLGSPAYIGGLKEGDVIVKVGSMDANNFKGLRAIGNIVSNYENMLLKIFVLRNEQLMPLYITPKKFDQAGLLGCHILPA